MEIRVLGAAKTKAKTCNVIAILVRSGRAGHRDVCLGRQKADCGAKWEMKTVDNLVSGRVMGISAYITPRSEGCAQCVPLCPITYITHEPPIILSVRTNLRISPSCLMLNLPPPPRPLVRALTSNSSSIMLWTNTRSGLRTTCLHIHSLPSSNLAILPVPLSPSFISKSRDQISPEAVMNGGQDGLIQQSTSSMLFLPHLERALVWYTSALNLLRCAHSYSSGRYSRQRP